MIERVAIILLVNLLFFSKTITYGYCSDDLTSFRNPVKFRNKWEKFFLQLNGALKIDQQMDHFITIVIHALTCVFIYISFGASDTSFLASLLFCFNPVNNQGSVWMSGRGYVVPTLMLLMAMVVPYLSVVFFTVSAFYNIGYIMPLILLGSGVWWCVLTLPIAWLIHFKQFKGNVNAKMKQEMFDDDKTFKPRKIILAIKTYGFYLVHALVPIKTTFYHSFLQSLAGNEIMQKRAYSIDRYFFIGVISISTALWYIFTHRWDLISFSILWWTVGIAPFLNLARMNQEISERYVYFPCVGLMFILATVLSAYPVLAAVFVTMYATKMWFFMDSFQDDYYLVENSCMNAPDAWYVWHIRGMHRWNNGSYKEALVLWTMAKLISPKEMKVLFNIATVLRIAGHNKEAEAFLAEAEQNIPKGQEEQSKEYFKKWRAGTMAVLL